MGLVDFAIDFAAVLGASGNIASKHVALRGRQLDRYGRTSSLVAAVKTKPRTGAETTATSFGEGKAGSTAAARKQDAPRNDTQDAADLSTVSIHEGAHKLSAVGSATLQGSGNAISDQPNRKTSELPIQPASNSSSLRDSRSQIEHEMKSDKANDASTASQPESQAKADEEPIPEGVNLDLFRTSRGSRLSPLWRGNRREQPIKPIVPEGSPEGLDLEIFRTGRGSSILRGLDDKARASRGAAAKTVLPEMRRTMEEATSSKAMAQKWPNPAIEHLSPSYESHRETEESEVPRYPNPADEDSNMETTPNNVVAQDLHDPKVNHVSPQYESRRGTEESEIPRYPDPSGEVSSVMTAASHSEPKTEKPVSNDDAVELGEILGAAATPTYELRESRVPSSRLGRIWSYGGLAAGMLTGAVSEFSSRAIGGGGQGSLMFSPANMERLVAKLSTMRGAALKIGQMMSFQDEKMLPAPIQKVLQRVQDRADYMPAWQRDRVLTTNLGAEWRDLYEDFEEKPIAAASIGQVHRAVLKSNGAKVAVKIQYPGVADSINSDLNNLRMLLAASKLLPKGLYLDKTIDNARVELGWECDYEREAQCALRYKSLLASESDVFRVPHIYPEASGKQVLTMEFMDGVGVTRIAEFTQAQRDWIGTQILRLCLREITEFRFMQTDPNWTNFLYDAERDRLVLLDFGASREYPERFIALYVQLLAAAARTDRDAIQALSVDLRYLTGHESKTMLDAHVTSILTLAEPFLESAPEVYDFKDQTITERVKAQIPVMIKERLAPPPEETYSLHRKLSGAFLLCARLGSRVRCREMFETAVFESGVLDGKV